MRMHFFIYFFMFVFLMCLERESVILAQGSQGFFSKSIEDNDFSGAPSVSGGRRFLAKDEAPEIYTVKPGDTLFDVCDQLLDDENYWPKLWSFNPFIQNPHFIEPGMKLAFFPGSDQLPPSLQIIDQENKVPLDSLVMNTANAEDIDEESFEETPLQEESGSLDDLSTSLGDQLVFRPEDLPVPKNFSLIEAGSAFIQRPSLNLSLPGFIVKDKYDPMGTVAGGFHGDYTSGEGHKLVIESDANLQMVPYTVVRYEGPVIEAVSGEFVGYKYQLCGQVKVARKMHDDGKYMAEVLMSRLSLNPGDLVIPYRSIKREVNLELSNRSSEANAAIVGFENIHQERSGEGELVFVWKKDGGKLQVGQDYKIFIQSVSRSRPQDVYSKTYDDKSYIGHLRIVDASDEAAIAYVSQSEMELRLGDSLTVSF